MTSANRSTSINGVRRFTLKKRSIRSPEDIVSLSSYNSDFLDGLFADVAKAKRSDPPPRSPPKRGSELMTTELSSDLSSHSETITPSKKSRLSLNRSMTRAGSSIINFASLRVSEVQSPKGINEFFLSSAGIAPAKTTRGLTKNHSLAYQLDSLGTESNIGEAAKLAFPNLPATVSDSSCSAGLTRANLVRNVSKPEKEPKESFGWFVDLDDNVRNSAPEVSIPTPTLPCAVSSDDLAFQAPTAPKRVNDEAELEWAQAADTIDDVLGDFF